ncbi:metallophosphatase [Synergistales bacterium]|nr:metallophosphatase [Synergistales bacterium]
MFSVLLLFTFAAESGEESVLVIYHTNDVHGYAFHETDKDGKPTRWGYDYVKAVVDGDDARNKMFLDAGDVLHGQSFATSRRGELVARILAMLDYDAIAAGNHDFDYGWERLLSLRDAYRLPFLSANVKDIHSGRPILSPYIVRDFADLRVGVFGLSTPSTPTKTDPRNVTGIEFGKPSDAVGTAREVVRHLREVESADIVIGLTHIGSEAYCDLSSPVIANLLSGVDLIIDGHSHTELSGGLKVNDTVIASAGSYLTHLGRVEVRRTGSGGYSFDAALIPAGESERVKPNPELSAAMGILKEELERELDVVAARTPISLNGARADVRYGSANLGRLLCASLIDGTGADIAFINSGMIRDSIPAGDITKGTLLSVLPYGNYVFTVDITGADLLDALSHGLSQPGSGAFPQFYGMTVEAHKIQIKLADGSTSEALAPEEVKIHGVSLKPDATYKAAITDFMYYGGDDYRMFGKYAYDEFGTLEDLFRNFLSESDEKSIKEIDAYSVLSVR